MVLQETKEHASDEMKLMNENPKIYIESTPNPGNGASTGVGFILNKDLIKGKKRKHTSIIAGRASRLQIE